MGRGQNQSHNTQKAVYIRGTYEHFPEPLQSSALSKKKAIHLATLLCAAYAAANQEVGIARGGKQTHGISFHKFVQLIRRFDPDACEMAGVSPHLHTEQAFKCGLFAGFRPALMRLSNQGRRGSGPSSCAAPPS